MIDNLMLSISYYKERIKLMDLNKNPKVIPNGITLGSHFLMCNAVLDLYALYGNSTDRAISLITKLTELKINYPFKLIPFGKYFVLVAANTINDHKIKLYSKYNLIYKLFNNREWIKDFGKIVECTNIRILPLIEESTKLICIKSVIKYGELIKQLEPEIIEILTKDKLFHSNTSGSILIYIKQSDKNSILYEAIHELSDVKYIRMRNLKINFVKFKLKRK